MSTDFETVVTGVTKFDPPISVDDGLYFFEDNCSTNIFNECDEFLSRPSVDKKSQNQLLSTPEELLQFFMLFNLSTRAMQYLLDMLKRIDINDVPPSLYHLLKEQRSKMSTLDVTRKDHFVYIGIENTLHYLIDKQQLMSSSTFDQKFINIKMQINLDGLPLYKSSSVNLWPILVQIDKITAPMPIGLFFGIGKPNMSVFLEGLCKELKVLFSSGMSYKNICVRCEDAVFICDAPARAYFQCIKGHNAFRGCGYCRQVGFRHLDSTVFQTSVGVPRSDALYAENKESNQTNVSPLVHVIPLRRNFPPDYLHCVLLGITRKLFSYYFTTVRGMRIPCKLSVGQQTLINNDVANFQKYIPREFQRRIRKFSELQHFKAAEFRTYLLYIGPIVLKNYLPTDYYRHFLLLHFAVYVFCSNSCKHLYSHAKSCIDLFVHQMPELFGRQSVVYNVHCLLHLHEYVELYGPLDSFSAFRFENYLGVLKRRIKCTNNIFQHCVNQLLSVREIYTSLSQPSHLFFSNSSPNNCAVLENNVYILIDFVSEDLVSGYKLYFVKSMYVYPYESSFLNIGCFRKSNVYLRRKRPISKAICVLDEDEFLVMPYVQ